MESAQTLTPGENSPNCTVGFGIRTYKYNLEITSRMPNRQATQPPRIIIVWLLGALPELGEWNPARAIETGQVEGEWKVWQAHVRLPVDTHFEWSWCTLTPDGRLKEWESPQKRQRRTSLFSGVLHTSWGEPKMEIFLQNMASANLFTVRRTKKGDVVAVVGSSASLGGWDPAKGVVATEFPRRSGHWSVTVFYDAASLQEWNWVIIDKESKQVKLAEKHKTRFLYKTYGWMKMNAPWNKDAEVVDWSPTDHTGGGEQDPGTVQILKTRKARLWEIHRWEELAELSRTTTGRMMLRPSVTATLQMEGRSPPPRMPFPRPLGPVDFPPYTPEDDRSLMQMQDTQLNNMLSSMEDNFVPVLKIKPFIDVEQPITILSPPLVLKKPPISPSPQKKSVSPSPAGSRPPSSTVRQQTKSPQPSPLPRPPLPTAQMSPPPGPIRPPQRAPASPGAAQQQPAVRPVLPRSVPRFEDAGKSSDPFMKNLVGGTQRKQDGRPSSPAPGSLSPQPTARREQRSKALAEDGSFGSALDIIATLSKESMTGPVDMSKAGYTRDPQCPVKGKGDRPNLVSDPGRPGYAQGPDEFINGPAGTCPNLDEARVRFLKHDKLETVEALSGDSGSTAPLSSPPVRRFTTDRDVEAARHDSDTVAPAARATSNTSVASNVGILGVMCDLAKPHPSLEDLKQLSEMREQARASERLRGLRDREERNRSKFEQSKQLAEYAAKPGPKKKSTTEKKDQATDTDGSK